MKREIDEALRNFQIILSSMLAQLKSVCLKIIFHILFSLCRLGIIGVLNNYVNICTAYIYWKQIICLMNCNEVLQSSCKQILYNVEVEFIGNLIAFMMLTSISFSKILGDINFFEHINISQETGQCFQWNHNPFLCSKYHMKVFILRKIFYKFFKVYR